VDEKKRFEVVLEAVKKLFIVKGIYGYLEQFKNRFILA